MPLFLLNNVCTLHMLNAVKHTNILQQFYSLEIYFPLTTQPNEELLILTNIPGFFY